MLSNCLKLELAVVLSNCYFRARVPEGTAKNVCHIGTLSSVEIHPREVFQPAVRHGAHSMMIAHNHPSGDPRPSRADYMLTQWLLRSAEVMGIDIEDHIIVGKERYISMQEVKAGL